MNRAVCRIPTILIAAALVLSSCSATANTTTELGETEPPESDETTESPETTESTDRYLVSFLDGLPASTIGSLPVYASDWQLAAEQYGIARLTDCSDPELALSHIIELTSDAQGPQAFISPVVSGGLRDVASFEVELGFSLCDVRTHAEGGKLPGTLTVFGIDQSAEETERKLLLDPVWGDELVVIDEGLDSEYFQWGDDPLRPDLDRRSGVRQLGRGGVLVARDGTVVRSPSEELVEELLSDGGSRLSDSKAITQVAEALADSGVHSLFIMNPWQSTSLGTILPSGDIEDLEEELRAASSLVSLKLYSVLGVGIGYDPEKQDHFLSVVMFNLNAEDAADNAENFRQVVEQRSSSVNEDRAWSDSLTVVSSESTGNLTIARLESGDTDLQLFRLANNVVFQRDNLFGFSGG